MTQQDLNDVQEALFEACARTAEESDLSVDVDLGEMGRLRVSADREAGGIRLSLVTESASSATVLETHTSAMLSVLQRGGFSVAGLQVQVGGDHGTGTEKKRDGAGSRTSKTVGVRHAEGSDSQVRPKDPNTRVDVLA